MPTAMISTGRSGTNVDTNANEVSSQATSQADAFGTPRCI